LFLIASSGSGPAHLETLPEPARSQGSRAGDHTAFPQGHRSFEIRHGGKPTVKVAEDEAQYFVAPTEHEGETVTEVDTRVSIVAPSFQEGNKWRVSDGSRTIYVAVEDPNFVGSVQSGREAFRKGDILHVKLQTRQWIEGTDLKAEHAIIKVLDHEAAPEQHSLDLSPGTKST
jgi:hypothetical protein